MITTHKNKGNYIINEILINNSNFSLYTISDSYFVYNNRTENWLIQQVVNYLWVKINVAPLIKDLAPSKIIIPYFDTLVYAFGIFGDPFSSIKLVTLVMSFPFGLEKLNVNPQLIGKYTKLKLFLLRKCLLNNVNIFCIQEHAVDFLLKKEKLNSDRISYIPDPIDSWKYIDRNKACEELGLQKSKFYVLVFGEISFRKGVDVIIDMINSNKLEQNTTFIFAGRQSKEVSQHIDSEFKKNKNLQYKLIIINKFINIKEERLLFHAVNLVWVAYRNFYYSSGVLLSAAKSGKAVVGTKQGLIGYYIAKHDIGFCIELDSIDAICKKINLFINSKHKINKIKDNGYKLSKMHSEKLFVDPIVENIRK